MIKIPLTLRQHFSQNTNKYFTTSCHSPTTVQLPTGPTHQNLRRVILEYTSSSSRVQVQVQVHVTSDKTHGSSIVLTKPLSARPNELANGVGAPSTQESRRNNHPIDQQVKYKQSNSSHINIKSQRSEYDKVHSRPKINNSIAIKARISSKRTCHSSKRIARKHFTCT